MSEIDHVYEVVDATSDEMYYPMGVFLLLDEAKNALRIMSKECSECSITEHGGEDGYEKIEVRQRSVGKLRDNDSGVPVFTMERKCAYDDDEDENIWSIIKSEDE